MKPVSFIESAVTVEFELSLVVISVGRYSGIWYYKLRTVFGIPRYLIKQVDESLSSVNG